MSIISMTQAYAFGLTHSDLRIRTDALWPTQSDLCTQAYAFGLTHSDLRIRTDALARPYTIGLTHSDLRIRTRGRGPTHSDRPLGPSHSNSYITQNGKFIIDNANKLVIFWWCRLTMQICCENGLKKDTLTLRYCHIVDNCNSRKTYNRTGQQNISQTLEKTKWQSRKKYSTFLRVKFQVFKSFSK